MKFSYNYFKNLDIPDFYLCNPDGRELYALNAYDRILTLRFNDLSSLTFKVPATITTSEGIVVDVPYYDMVRTKRIVSVKDVGEFIIKSVNEHEEPSVRYKEVTAESHQAIFKDKSVTTEERVYGFYNNADPYDANYDDTNLSAIPSIVGQLYRQLGIQIDIAQGQIEPNAPYEKWTITYISPELYYNGSQGNIFRTFTKNSSVGYSWMVSDVAEAFGVIFIFDILYKTIHIKLKSEAAEKSNIILSFDNFIENIDINEDADNIVTVLSCEGSGLDISMVNPTGTKYIVDFSYYMDETTYKWMSPALITKIKQWNNAVDAAKNTYADLIAQMRGYYQDRLTIDETLKHISMTLKDLKNARDNRIKDMVSAASSTGIVLCEAVDIGSKSRHPNSDYKNTALSLDSLIVGYSVSPEYSGGQWVFPTGVIGTIATAAQHYANGRYYFKDGNSDSYCKLVGTTAIDKTNDTYQETLAGFKRFIDYSQAQTWINLYEKEVASLNNNLNSVNASIESTSAQLEAISSALNIKNYFSNAPNLWKELECYWIEGSYQNNNIAVLDSTTIAEEIDLANELMEAGRLELSYVSQPHYSFSITPSNALAQYEFKDQLNSLELGDIVAVERDNGVIFYPLLLELQFGFDDSSQFSLSFANATRLDDWGYTYADLINSATGTARQVSANWQDITSFAKEKVSLVPLIQNPLDTTLRAAIASAKNQSFVVDDTGILGRQKIDEDGNFSDRQLRIINNMLIFTDDNWNTARAALGEISYTDGGVQRSAYGLIADTIIGNFIVGEKLMITNDSTSFVIDKDGIKLNTGSAQDPAFITVDSVINSVQQSLIAADGMLESKIIEERNRAENAEGFLSSRITQTANEIIAEVSNSISNVSSSISQLANSISLVVDSSNNKIKAASIVAAINNDTSSVTLSADKINLNGTVSANGTFLITTEGYMTCTGGTIGGIQVTSSGISAGSTLTNVSTAHPMMRADINNHIVTYNSSGWYNWIYAVTPGDTYVISGLVSPSSRIELHFSSNDSYITSGSKTLNNHSYSYYASTSSAIEISVKIPAGASYLTINKNNSTAPTVKKVGSGGAFTLSSTGELTCLKANITGTINATDGYIGAWRIVGGGLIGSSGGNVMVITTTEISCGSTAMGTRFAISEDRTVLGNTRKAYATQQNPSQTTKQLWPLYIDANGLLYSLLPAITAYE